MLDICVQDLQDYVNHDSSGCVLNEMLYLLFFVCLFFFVFVHICGTHEDTDI